jgi:hypothetical protein
MAKFEFKAARELVDGDLIELRELPFRYTSEAKGYRSEDGDQLVRVGSERGPHTLLGSGRLTLHTDVGDYDVVADLDFLLMGKRS